MGASIMAQKSKWNNAWWEATFDTIIAGAINFPLNMLLLWVAAFYGMSVLWTSIFLTGVFTVIAIVRKATVRTMFKRKENSCNNHEL